MTTVQMIIEADMDGETYKSFNLYYSKQNGFTEKNGKLWEGIAFQTLNELLAINDWELHTPVLSEAERVILSNVDPESGWDLIERSGSGTLVLCRLKELGSPIRSSFGFYLYNHLFSMVKPGAKAVSIAQLLRAESEAK